MRKALAYAVAALLVAGAAAGAAEFWEKKKYQQWTAKECQKLLTDSPWAKQRTYGEVNIDLRQDRGDPTSAQRSEPPVAPVGPDSSAGSAASPSSTELRGREANPRLTYQVQLRSALPIREALVRQAQLRQDYDTMSGEQKQAFDQEAEKFLGADYSERVVVYVTYDSNIDFDKRALLQHWQNQTTGTLKNIVYLIGAGGRKVTLIRYSHAPGQTRGFQFDFPRELEGQPLLGPGDKALLLEFPHPSIRGQVAERALLEFKVNKMLVDGQLAY